jgi:hypothetical protein
MTTKDLPARITRGNRKHTMHSATSEEEGSVSGTADHSTGIRIGLQKHSFSIKEFCELHAISRSCFLPAAREGRSSTADEGRTADACFGRSGCGVAQKHGTHSYHQAENCLSWIFLYRRNGKSHEMGLGLGARYWPR